MPIADPGERAAYMRAYRQRHKTERAEYMRDFRAADTHISQAYRDREQRRANKRHSVGRKVPLFLCIDGELSPVSATSGSVRRVYDLVQFYCRVGGVASEWRLSDPVGVGLVAFARTLKKIVHSLRKRLPDRRIMPVWFAGSFDVDQMIGNERSLDYAGQAAIVATHSPRFGIVRSPEFTGTARLADDIRIRWGKKACTFDFSQPGANQFYGVDRNGDNGDNGGQRKSYRITVIDVWSITARSFVKTIEAVCMPHWTAGERAEYQPLLDIIVEGKESRQYADWRGWQQKDIERYNRAELILLGHYCDTLWRLCESTGIFPRSFAGPAPFARALQRAYGVSAHSKPDEYDSVAYQESEVFRHELATYYGGRIELAGQGWVTGLLEYDLRSAYPDAERQAPCFAHGTWRTLNELDIRRTNETAFIACPAGSYEISWWLPTGYGRIPRWGPLPVRDSRGVVTFPLSGRGWYKGIEIQALLECWPGDWCIHAGQAWESTCHLAHPRQEMIEETYNKRAALKQTGDGGELVLKLALNSCYGISAQTSGAYREIDDAGKTIAYHTPASSNASQAAWDTAYVRARLYRTLTSSGADTVAAATDAVYSHSPLYGSNGLPLESRSADLGTWEVTAHEGERLLIAPGLSITRDAVYKRRGFAGHMDIAALVSAWDHAPAHDRTFPIVSQRYKDLRASLHKNATTGKWTRDADWGEFQTLTRRINLTASILAGKRDTDLELGVPPHDFTVYPPRRTGHRNTVCSVGYRRPFDSVVSGNQTAQETETETMNELFHREREISEYAL